MKIDLAILLVIAVLNVILGLLIFIKNPKNIINQIFFVFALGLGVWSLGMMEYHIDPFDKEAVLFWSKILYFAGSIISTSLFAFSLAFTKKIKWYYVLPLIFINLLVFYYLFIDKLIVVNVINQLGNRQLIHGSFYPFYFLHFFFFVFLSTLIFFLEYLKSSGVKKSQLKLIMLGVLIPGLASSIINMILPAYGNFKFAWIGPIFLFILLGSIGYSITKHALFNIKVIATELFVGLLTFMMLIWAIGSATIFPYIILLGTIVSGLLIIKSIQKEIEQKENLKKLTNQLKETNQKLKELGELKDDFLSMASHELNTPLAAIEGYLSMILEEKIGGELNPKHKKFLDKVYRSSLRLAKLVSDLLNVSRIEQNRIHLIFENANINKIIEQSISETKPNADEKHQQIIFTSNEKLPETWCDIDRITEVVINLIGNAIKYSHPNTKIEVNTTSDSNQITVSIKDNGVGISPEDQKQIFKKFERGKLNFTKDSSKGTGLGLFISKNLVELHNGKIWLESKEDAGSTFYFSLPLLKEKPRDKHKSEGAILKLK